MQRVSIKISNLFLSLVSSFSLCFTLKLQPSSFFFLSSYLSVSMFIYVFPLFNLCVSLSHSEYPKASVAITTELL